MTFLNELLLVSAFVLAVGVAAGGLSSRLGVPSLLVFLLVGMGFGENGPGGIQFEDYSFSFAVGNLALAIILLDGGLRTPLPTFRIAFRPALVLASLGVALTALILGLFSTWVLGLDWRIGLLMGAIVSSTDAAAVFAMLRAGGVRLNDRIGATLEIESGANDPMAIFLTTLLIGIITSGGEVTFGGSLLAFVRQFGIGTVAGLAAGWLMGATLRWWTFGHALTAIFLCAVGVVVFALVNLIGGSGFLAVYLFGVILTARAGGRLDESLPAMDGMAWLSQAGMFVLLGLLATPIEMVPLLGPALLVAVFLIVVARPVAVWLCLLPLAFNRAETAFIAWTGLRGAVPIVLSVFPLMADVPHAKDIFNVVFVVVLVSLIVQGTTLPAAARLLGVELPLRGRPLSMFALASGLRLAEFRVADASFAAGQFANSLELPEGCRLADVCRGRSLLEPDLHALQVGDIVGVVGPRDLLERIPILFDGEARAEPAPRSTFVLAAEAGFGDVADAYGLEVPDRLRTLELGRALDTVAQRPLVEGDRVQIGPAIFVIEETASGRPRRIGLRLEISPRPSTGH